MNQISHQALAGRISATGCPSEGWTAFKRHYAPQAAAEKPRLTQSWYSVRMKVGESPNEYFSRGCELSKRYGIHGMVLHDIEVKQHFVCNLSPIVEVQESIFLTNAELAYQVLEDVVLSANGEIEISKEQELRNGTGHALLVADADRGMGVLKTAGEVTGADAEETGATAAGVDFSSDISSRTIGSSSSISPPAVGVVAVGAEGHSSWVMEAEDLAAGEAEEGMEVVVRRPLGVGGVAFVPSSSRDGYDYSRYPQGLPRPIDNQQPVHGTDPRRRFHNCYELGHVHQHCA